MEYRVIAVHLKWNLIFLAGEDKKLIAYDMKLRKVLVLATHFTRNGRPSCLLSPEGPHYLAFVPVFME